MKNLLDFLSGGIFNIIGALARKPFSDKTLNKLVEETQSNNVGMLVTAILMFIVFAYIKLSL